MCTKSHEKSFTRISIFFTYSVLPPLYNISLKAMIKKWITFSFRVLYYTFSFRVLYYTKLDYPFKYRINAILVVRCNLPSLKNLLKDCDITEASVRKFFEMKYWRWPPRRAAANRDDTTMTKCLVHLSIRKRFSMFY